MGYTKGKIVCGGKLGHIKKGKKPYLCSQRIQIVSELVVTSKLRTHECQFPENHD